MNLKWGINMISITKLLYDSHNYGDSLRYVEGAALAKYGVTKDKGPVGGLELYKNLQFKM